eukprot:2721498-Rhodomonas_salina.1
MRVLDACGRQDFLSDELFKGYRTIRKFQSGPPRSLPPLGRTSKRSLSLFRQTLTEPCLDRPKSSESLVCYAFLSLMLSLPTC